MKKVSLIPFKNFCSKLCLTIRLAKISKRGIIQVILRPSFKTAEGAQMLHRRKESSLSLSACMLCADGQPLRGYPSQNDVKFQRTCSPKVLVKFFQKLAGCGAEPHSISPINQKFTHLLYHIPSNFSIKSQKITHRLENFMHNNFEVII